MEELHVESNSPAGQDKTNIIYFLVDNLDMGELSVTSGGPRSGQLTLKLQF